MHFGYELTNPLVNRCHAAKESDAIEKREWDNGQKILIDTKIGW